MLLLQQLLLQPFTALWTLFGTTRVSQYQKYHGHQTFLYLLPPSFTIRGIILVQFTSLTVFFHNLSLGRAPSTSNSIHFFTQSLSSFHSTCPYHRNLFCCITEIMSSNSSLSLNPLLGTLSCSLMPHIHLTILIYGYCYC